MPCVSEASGTAEREAALAMLGRQAGRHRVTLGADKAYDVADFVADLRALNVTPARRPEHHQPPLGDRPPDHAPPGYAISQRLRPRIEESFGWIKTVGGLRKTRHRGTARVGWLFTLTAAACNLIRLPKLLAAPDHARPRMRSLCCPTQPRPEPAAPNPLRHPQASKTGPTHNPISAAC